MYKILLTALLIYELLKFRARRPTAGLAAIDEGRRVGKD